MLCYFAFCKTQNMSVPLLQTVVLALQLLALEIQLLLTNLLDRVAIFVLALEILSDARLGFA
jgi:hypothetical protein